MDLKIKDVAELLNVSETTIRRWISDDKIPAYRINHQYRFSRIEIENWVLQHKLGKTNGISAFNDNKPAPAEKNTKINAKSPSGGNKQFSLYRAIHKGGVLHNVAGDTKEEVIRNAMKIIAKNLSVDEEVVTELLLDRETLMPTALNNGIGVPHTRDSLLNAHQDVVTIVFPAKPVNYKALDGKDVHTMFFLFACEDKRHLHLLAKIAHLSNRPESLKFLQSQPDKEQLMQFIKDWESSITKVSEE